MIHDNSNSPDYALTQYFDELLSEPEKNGPPDEQAKKTPVSLAKAKPVVKENTETNSSIAHISKGQNTVKHRDVAETDSENKSVSAPQVPQLDSEVCKPEPKKHFGLDATKLEPNCTATVGSMPEWQPKPSLPPEPELKPQLKAATPVNSPKKLKERLSRLEAEKKQKLQQLLSTRILSTVETPTVETQEVETPAVEIQEVETHAVETQTVETHVVETQAVESTAQAIQTEAPVGNNDQIEKPLALESAARIHQLLEWDSNGRPKWAQGRFEALLFTVSGLTLAVPLIALGQIQPLTDELTPIFGQSDWFMGILPSAAGKLRTVNTALFVMPERYNARFLETAKYVVSIDGLEWGLAVDSVNQPISIDPSDVNWRSARTSRPWLAGTVKSAMCALVDIPQMANLLLQSEKKPV